MTKAITFSNEKGVKTRVKKLLDDHKWFWWMPAANGFGSTGVSDFCCLRDGVFMVVETKFGKNKTSAMQRAFCRSVLQENGFAFVVSDSNIDWFEAWLGAFDRSVAATAKRQAVAPEDGAMMLNAIREMQVAIFAE